MSPQRLGQRSTVSSPALSPHIAALTFLLPPPFPTYSSFSPCFPSSSLPHSFPHHPFSCLLPFSPHFLTLLSFLFSFPLLLSPSLPHSINPYSPPSLGSSPIPGPKPHPLFSIKWEGQSGSPDLLCPAVGVGLGLHRRAALNDKR